MSFSGSRLGCPNVCCNASDHGGSVATNHTSTAVTSEVSGNSQLRYQTTGIKCPTGTHFSDDLPTYTATASTTRTASQGTKQGPRRLKCRECPQLVTRTLGGSKYPKLTGYHIACSYTVTRPRTHFQTTTSWIAFVLPVCPGRLASLSSIFLWSQTTAQGFVWAFRCPFSPLRLATSFLSLGTLLGRPGETRLRQALSLLPSFDLFL